ncbi:MAG: 50S ribosomal protein L32 [Candidatus Wildermuthbacteria bacterium]|nr:50S ribosomal protein L32 [Candidatus Wildermuthbacteria bacterium]
MAVPKWRRSKSKQGQRRMHLFIKSPKLLLCSNCKKQAVPHRMCPHCGFYRGREVMGVLAKLAKKEAKRKSSHA